MDERDQKLAQPSQWAAEHLPAGQDRGVGVSAYDPFVEAYEAELEVAGYSIEQVRGAARPPSAGD